jgi:hypothetical protein
MRLDKESHMSTYEEEDTCIHIRRRIHTDFCNTTVRLDKERAAQAGSQGTDSQKSSAFIAKRDLIHSQKRPTDTTNSQKSSAL